MLDRVPKLTPPRPSIASAARRLVLLALALFLPLAAGGQYRITPDELARQPPPAMQARAAQLATADWTAEDLKAWWAALRALDGSGASLSENLPAQLLPPAREEAWHSVRLPDVRERQTAGIPQSQRYQMRWYRLRYAPPQEGHWPGNAALYMPRVVTLAAAVLVRTESGWRPIFDNQAGAREQWVRPLWAVFPSALPELHQGKAIELVVAVPVLADSHFAVSSAWLGAREALEPRHQQRWFMQIGVPQATGLTLLVLGLFALALWARRREPAYLLFALASLAWLVRNLQYHLDLPPTREGLVWFWWLTLASMSWVIVLSFLFAMRVSARDDQYHRRDRRMERVLLGVVVVSCVLTMPIWLRWLDTLVLQHFVNALIGTAVAGLVLARAWRDGSRELRVIAAALLISLLLGIHDLALLAGWAWPEDIYLLPFATLVMVGSFLYAVQRRYVGALDAVEAANASLAGRLAAQGDQMRAQHERLRESERQQALMVERQRLMQDMHDGLGSALLSAMVAVEQGSLSQDKVADVLRECVDDLRLVIDSMEPTSHDLVALLATMRYRLGKRLQISGLTLDWDVQDLPPLHWLEPPDALQVLRLMQEALNNVIKHAKARRVRLVTRHYGSFIEIRVEDDGQGFDMENARKGRGLKSQQKRAEKLGGHVHVESEPGRGTKLSLRLPVVRKAPGRADEA